jgi:predicted O-linked N-acetylglucosamine transferase (SPINDLY family)
VPRLEYLANYHQVDLVLDTFPFPGGTTTCEALWMGVPTLTLAGKSMLSRQGASLMTAAGLPEWVACSEDDFVTKAIILAGSKQALERLAALRGGLRELLASSPLFSASRFARHLEQALWGMWETWQGQFL